MEEQEGDGTIEVNQEPTSHADWGAPVWTDDGPCEVEIVDYH